MKNYLKFAFYFLIMYKSCHMAPQEAFYREKQQAINEAREHDVNLPDEMKKWVEAQCPDNRKIYYIKAKFFLKQDSAVSENESSPEFFGYVEADQFTLETGAIHIPLFTAGNQKGVRGSSYMIEHNQQVARQLLEITIDQDIDEVALSGILGIMNKSQYGQFLCSSNGSGESFDLIVTSSTQSVSDSWRDVSGNSVNPFIENSSLLTVLGINDALKLEMSDLTITQVNAVEFMQALRTK